MSEPVEQPDHIDALAQGLASLIAESRSLRVDVHTAEQARRRSAYINTGVLIVFVVLIVMLVSITAQTNAVARKVRDTNNQVADCTTVGGKCYNDGRERTGEAINDILRADIYVSECGRERPGQSGPAYNEFLETCVAAKLSQLNITGPSASPTPTVSPTK